MSLEMIEQAKTMQLLGAEEFFLNRFKDEQSRVISIRRRVSETFRDTKADGFNIKSAGPFLMHVLAIGCSLRPFL